MVRFYTNVVRWCLVSCVALLGVGCGQRANEDVGQVRMSFPSWVSLRKHDVERQSKNTTMVDSDLGTPSMVVVNISGPGISPAIFIPLWNNHDSSSSSSEPPADKSIEVPRGNDRLIQVLAVYESKSMSFYYAEAKTSVGANPVDVSLTLRNVAVSGSLQEGNMVGRFFSDSTTGPTAKFQYRFKPPSGSQGLSIVVHEGEMFAGWASIFALSSPLLTYTFLDGKPLPLAGVTHASTGLVTPENSSRMARIYIPGGYENRSWEPDSYEMSPVKEKYLAVGFFGSGPSKRQRVCLGDKGENVQGLYRTYTPNEGPQNQITWRGRDNYNRDRAAEAYVEEFGGAVGGDDGVSCAANQGEVTGQSPPVPYEDYIPVRGKQILHSDSVAGFRGPFRQLDVMADYASMMAFNYDYGTSSLNVSWKYLPGAGNDLAGVSVFYKYMSMDEVSDDKSIRDDGGDGYRCKDLAQVFGYSEVRASQGEESATITNLSETDIQTTRFVLCPRAADGTYYTSAVSSRYWSPYYGGDDGPNGGGTPCPGSVCSPGGGYVPTYATQLHLVAIDRSESTDPATPKQFGVDACLPFRIVPTDNDGNEAWLQNPIEELTITVTGTDHEIYDNDNTCGSGGTTSIVKNDYQFSYGRIYLKVRSDSVGEIAVTTTGAHAVGSTAYHFTGLTATADSFLVITEPEIYRYSCSKVAIVGYDSVNEVMAPITDSGYVSFNVTQPKVYMASDFECSGSTQSSYYYSGTGQTLSEYMLKFDDPDPSVVELPELIDLSNPPFDTYTQMFLDNPAPSIIDPGAPARLQIVMPTSLVNLGECVPVYVKLVDNDGYSAQPFTEEIDLQLAATTTGGAATGEFFPYSNCDYTPDDAPVIPPDSNVSFIKYFKASATGPVTISIASVTVPSSSTVDTVVAALSKTTRQLTVDSWPVKIVAKSGNLLYDSTIPSGNCDPVLLQLTGPDDYSTAPAPEDMVINFTKSNVEIYSTAACNSGDEITDYNFLQGQTTGVIFIKPQGSSYPPASIDMSGQHSKGNLISQTFSEYAVDGILGEPDRLGLLTIKSPSPSHSAWRVNDCHPILVKVNDSSGYISPVVSATDVDLSTPGIASAAFYTDQSCSGSPATTVTIDAQEAFALVWVKIGSQVSSSSANQILFTPSVGSSTCNPSAPTDCTPAYYDYFKIN